MDDSNLERFNLKQSKGNLLYINAFDTRKPRLTLNHLNKMKKFKAVSELENLKRQSVLSTIYGTPDEDTGGF